MNFLKRFRDVFIKNQKLKMPLAVIVFLFGVLFIGTNLFFANYTNDSFPQEYKIISPKIPNHVTIFGEGVPLENFEVYERVESDS